MLKREINEQLRKYKRESFTTTTFESKENTLTLWEKLQNKFIVFQTITTILAVITCIFQIALGNPILHMVLCGILIILYVFLFALSKNSCYKTEWYYILISSIWLINMLLTIPKLF